MRTAITTALAILVLAEASLATREPTVPPVYYLIDYGRNHIDNPEYINWVKELPPELLHFGKDVPMTHLWGPIAAVGGENQAHGRNRADIRRLTPDEVRARIAALRRMNDALHEAGVKFVLPYISAFTYAGHPETREGLFEFYDHWHEYAQFGLGPKPKSDPAQWAALKGNGAFHTFGPVLAPPYYTGLNRYVACVEHPGWRHWLRQVARLVAEAGYDGAFADNSSAMACYARYCQRAFGGYLSGKFRPEQLRELLGTRDATAIKLPTEKKGLLWVEANRFWRQSLAQHLAAVREAGRQANPDFLLFPNCGAPTYLAEYLVGHVDYMMFEGGRGPQGAGCLVTPIIGDIARRKVMDNILDYRYVADIPGDLRPMLLKLGRTPSARKLCLAEAAAFGSGAYNGVRPSTREIQRPYIEFLLKHKALYANKVSSSQVALLYFPMLGFYGAGHPRSAVNVKDRLGTLQIPFDCFSETGLDLAPLRTYPVCIAAEMEYLSDAHLDILHSYVLGGGRLLTIGEIATHDELCQERERPEWLPEEGERKLGEGAVAQRTLVPTRTEMLELLSTVGEQRLVVEEGRMGRPMLRVMAYGSDEERIVHLLNYSCPVEAGAWRPMPERNVQLRVPLPAGKQVKAVVCLTPEGPQMALPFIMRDSACWFVVPEVRIYAVCRVELR